VGGPGKLRPALLPRLLLRRIHRHIRALPPPITLAPHPQRLASPSRPVAGIDVTPKLLGIGGASFWAVVVVALIYLGYELQVGQHRLLAVDHQLLGGHLGNGDRNAAFIPVLR